MTKKERVPSPPASDYDDEEQEFDEEFGESEIESLQRGEDNESEGI